jgi:hypothetical protein
VMLIRPNPISIIRRMDTVAQGAQITKNERRRYSRWWPKRSIVR